MKQPLPGKLARQLESDTRTALIVVSEDGIVQLWSAGAEVRFGVTRAGAVGQPLRSLVNGVPAGDQALVPALGKLTPRQRQVLALIVDGHSTRDIALRVGRSTKTIEAHRAHIMRRLGVKNLASLIRVALGMELRSAGD